MRAPIPKIAAPKKYRFPSATAAIASADTRPTMIVSTTPINIWPNWTATIGTARRVIARSSARKVIGIAGMSGQNVCQATSSAPDGF